MNPEPLSVADWLALVPAILVAAAVLVLPGLAVVAATTRLKPWNVALAPAVSVALVGVGATVWGLTPLRFSWITVAVTTLVVSGVAYAARRLVRADGGADEPRVTRSQWLWPAGGLLVGGAIIAAQMIRAIGYPNAISQTFDAIFHVNAVQWVVTSGTGSVFGLVEFTGNTFYPMAWHNITALVVQLTGVSIPEAISAANVAIAAIAWPAGCAALVAVLLPRRASVLGRSISSPHRDWLPAVVAVLAAAFGAFPFRLIEFGVLYPNFLSVAILPAALAATAKVLGVPFPETHERGVPSRGRFGETVVRALLVMVACAGLGLAQPNGLMSLIAMSLPLMAWLTAEKVRLARREGDRRAVLSWVVGSVAVLALVAALWQVARPPAEAATWEPAQSLASAIGIALTVSPWTGTIAWVVVWAMAAGVVTSLRKPEYLATTGPYLMTVVLYLFVSAVPTDSALRSFLTGVYFNDSVRVAALLPVGAVVVCAIGVETLVTTLRNVAARFRVMRSPRALAAGSVLLSLVLLYGVALDNGNVDHTVRAARATHARSGPLLTDDERAVLERLPEYTADDALIAGNPGTGAALALALGDRAVTEPHVFNEASDDIRFVAANLDEIDDNPQVCAAILRSGIHYVLDFGSRSVLPWDATGIDYSGFNDVRAGDHLELVMHQGRAELFRVNCER